MPDRGNAPLSDPQRAARAAVGAGVTLLALGSLRSVTFARGLVASGLGWFGVSHLVAAATRYNGCPERGAIPSLLLGRHVPTRCSPWETIDARLGLNDHEREATHV